MAWLDITNPDTGKKFRLYLTEESSKEIEEFRDAYCRHDGQQELRIFTSSNNAKHNRNQCLICGKAVGQSISNLTINNRDELRPFDDAVAGAYEKKRKSELENIYRKLIRKQQEEDIKFSAEYREYMASPEWRSKADKVLKRARGICEGCLESTATQVHHLTYEHFGDELLFELVALCPECHARCHQRDDAEDSASNAEQSICDKCQHHLIVEEVGAWCEVLGILCEEATSADGMCGPDRSYFE